MNTLLVFALMINVGFCLKTHYMNTLCASSLSLRETGKESNLQLFFSEKGHEKTSESNCSLTVSTKIGSFIVVTVRKFFTSPLCHQYLEITTETSKSHYCTSFMDGTGTGLESNVLVYKQDSIDLNVILGGSHETVPGFDIIFTSVKAAPCPNGTYRCNNDLCVWSLLVCDKINNCGDNSDEIGGERRCPQIFPTTSGWTYLYIAIFAFFVLLAMALCLSVCFCLSKSVELRREKSKRLSRYAEELRREEEMSAYDEGLRKEERLVDAEEWRNEEESPEYAEEMRDEDEWQAQEDERQAQEDERQAQEDERQEQEDERREQQDDDEEMNEESRRKENVKEEE